jgi:hypothetical protein
METLMGLLVGHRIGGLIRVALTLVGVARRASREAIGGWHARGRTIGEWRGIRIASGTLRGRERVTLQRGSRSSRGITILESAERRDRLSRITGRTREGLLLPTRERNMILESAMRRWTSNGTDVGSAMKCWTSKGTRIWSKSRLSV